MADKLASLAYENPDTLEIVSENLNLGINNSGFFSRDRTGDDFLSNPKIISASFSEDVLINGNNSEPIEIEDNHIVVLRVLEHQPEKTKPLEEVRDIIITRVKYDRARAATEKQGKLVINDLKNNVPKEQIAEKYALEWNNAPEIRRDEKDINPVILNTAFSAGRPAKNMPVFGGSSLASGDYAVTIVHDVKDNEQGSMTDEELQTLKIQLQRLDAINTWSAFMEDLKGRADIQVYSDNL
jgi:peptidyl-prolyl cis-trans isomerase D